MTFNRWAAACEALADASPLMAAAIEGTGPCPLVRRRVGGGAFGALARAVCFQQLGGAAASAIHKRFEALYGGQPTPAAVLATPNEALRAAGLSAGKVASIKDLAAKALDGTVRLDRWERRSDEEIVESLSLVRGIGPWTAQMFLIFQLNRPDVWPTGDYGVRVGFRNIHGLPDLPTPGQLLVLGEPYRPWRTIAAWYCWRAVRAETP